MHRIHLLVGNQDDVEDPAVVLALDEAAAVDDPAHPAALRDDAVVDRIVLLVVPVRASVDLLPDARIHPIVVVGMDDAAKAVLRVVEEIVEVIALEQADEFFIGEQDVLALRIVDQDGGWQVEDNIAQREAHLHAARRRHTRGIAATAILAAQLDRVERRIRIAKHIERRFAICPVGRVDGIPHRDGIVIDRLPIVELLLEADKIAHDALSCRQVIGRQHDDELVTAVEV